MKTLYEEAGKRILNLRTSKSLSREQLAEMANISPKFLYEMETGRKGFSAEVLFHIADALSVKCDYIMQGTLVDCFDDEMLMIMETLEVKEIECIKNILRTFYHFLYD